MYARGTYAANSYGGLPPEVASAVDEISRNSGVEGMQLIQRAGFIQLADMPQGVIETLQRPVGSEN